MNLNGHYFELYEIFWLCIFAAVLLIGVPVVLIEAWRCFWNWYDDRMQNSKRIANADIDAAYSTRQFYVPPTMRDCK